MRALTDSSEKKEDFRNVLNTERYKIEKKIGSGSWGGVYLAFDKFLNKTVAIKVPQPNEFALKEMERMNISLGDIIHKEASTLAACSHIVPREYDVDNDGRPFIVMPPYKRFLEDIIESREEEMRQVRHTQLKNKEKQAARHFLDNYQSCLQSGLWGNGTSFMSGRRDSTVTGRPLLGDEEINNYMNDIALGLAEMHGKLRRVHADLKPANIAVDDEGNLLISDLGTSTLATISQNHSPKDNAGTRLIRAPELWGRGSHPTRESDIWSFGALAMKFCTNHYPLERILNNISDREEQGAVVRSLGYKAGNTFVREQAKQIPRIYRGLILKCLDFRPDKRYANGNELAKEVKEITEHSPFMYQLRKSILRWAVPLGIPAAAITGIAYTIAFHPEPKELTMPQISQQSPLYVNAGNLAWSVEEKDIIFDRETLPKLPATRVKDSGLNRSELAKMATKNRVVAYMLRRYLEAEMDLNNDMIPNPTESQYKYWTAYTRPEERGLGSGAGLPPGIRAITKSIEVGLNKAQTAEGHVDLEDALVIARLGDDKLHQLQKKAGSFEYREYSKEISPADQKFISTWLGYINSEPW